MIVKYMLVSCGIGGCSNVKRHVEIIDTILRIGCIVCLECGGSGWWDYGPPGTEGHCVNCKRTGKQYVSI